jgi:hypothetical protein
MKKKKSAKKRPKPKPRRQQNTRAKSKPQKARGKSRPRVVTGVGRITGRAGLDESTQSGDTQGLSDRAVADSESVKELMEEGQYLEAEAVEGVEDAPDADAGPIRTKEVPEDDVPGEYRDDDNRDQQS